MPLVFMQALTIHMVNHVKAADWVIPPSLIHPTSASAAAEVAALQRARRAADDEEDEGGQRRQRGGGGGGEEAVAPGVEVGQPVQEYCWPVLAGLQDCDCKTVTARLVLNALEGCRAEQLAALWQEVRESCFLAAWRR
eukprot:1155629-Pelagomonas_calceolata.AAC.3